MDALPGTLGKLRAMAISDQDFSGVAVPCNEAI
jgi:hypothetical protein